MLSRPRTARRSRHWLRATVFLAVYPFRLFAELGGLLSYGNDRIDPFRRAATYADRILRGAKPSELPIQAPVKFDLVINMKPPKRSASTCLGSFSNSPTR